MGCGFLLQNVLTFSSKFASYLNRAVGHHLLLADGSYNLCAMVFSQLKPCSVLSLQA